jgi:hypothetical protein
MNPASVKTLFFYLPLKIKKSDIIGLGKMMEENRILNGVFNERYMTKPENKTFTVLQIADSTQVFEVYMLNMSNQDMKIEKSFGGSILSFDISELAHNKSLPLYLRFRLKYPLDEKGRNVLGCFKEYWPKYPFFESAFNVTETTDFRINENRNQDKDLIERMSKGKTFSITEVRYFLIMPNEENLNTFSELGYQRQLEKDGFWNSYLEIENASGTYGEMSVYKYVKHGTASDPLDHFRIFYKSQYRKSNWRTIIPFVIVSLVLVTLYDAFSEALRHQWLPDFCNWVRQMMGIGG